MFKNSSLKIAFLISISIHVFLLYFLPNIKAFQGERQLTREIKVVYQKLKIESGQNLPATLAKPYAKQKMINPKDIPLKNKDLRMPLLKERLYEDFKITRNKEPILPKIDSAKKKVTLPDIEQPKIKNPAYLSYYQEIREKIRRSAYSNYSNLEEGEVYLSFIIGSDGNLKDIKVLDEKSTDNPRLKDISIKSVRDGMPYPAFPKELNYPQLSFNVIISYELE